jgi:hypothetical protein
MLLNSEGISTIHIKQVLNVFKAFCLFLEDQFVENGVVFFMTLMFESYFWKINAFTLCIV